MEAMPKPGEQHARIQRLVGTWVGEETLNPSPWSAGGKRTGRYDNRAICGGLFVVGDYQQHDNDQKVYEGHGVFGVDGKSGDVHWYWVDSMGQPSLPSRGRWEGDTLTLLGKSDEGKLHGRYTWRLEGDRRLYFKLENSQDGGKSWATFMEARYTRQQ